MQNMDRFMKFMKFIKFLLGSCCFTLILACNHPIEIIGDGDVTSASGNRNCYLEDYRAGNSNCAKNTVVGEYQETYYATPRDGWEFKGWEGCQVPLSDTCGFDVPQETVIKAWGNTAPPLIANFLQMSPGVEDALYYTAGNYGVVGSLDPTSGQIIGTYNPNILGGLADLQVVNGELYAIKSYGSTLHKIDFKLQSETTIGATGQLADDSASLLSTAGKLYGVYGYYNDLYEINLATGFAQRLGISLPGRVVAFDGNGVLYALELSYSTFQLHTIDFNSGSILSSLGFSYSNSFDIWDMAFTSKELIAITRSGELVRIDRDSGQAIPFAAISIDAGLVAGLTSDLE